MISKDKTYKTRDGREVRIYATDGYGRTPIHGAVNCPEGWVCMTWHPNGQFFNDLEVENDLIEVKPRIKRTVWINIFKKGTLLHETREDADAALGVRLACVKVEIDCEEGEGL